MALDHKPLAQVHPANAHPRQRSPETVPTLALDLDTAPHQVRQTITRSYGTSALDLAPRLRKLGRVDPDQADAFTTAAQRVAIDRSADQENRHNDDHRTNRLPTRRTPLRILSRFS
jgi:hypothetical protein